MDWSGVDYLWFIVMFNQLFGLSFWRHPFTAEDPLLSKLCNAAFLQLWWRNILVCILDDLRESKRTAALFVLFVLGGIFWVNYSFKMTFPPNLLFNPGYV